MNKLSETSALRQNARHARLQAGAQILLIGSLVFVWSIPHTTALRYLLAVLLIGSLVPVTIQSRQLPEALKRTLARETGVLLVLLAWMLAGSAIWALEPSVSRAEAASLWGRSVAFFCIGAWIAAAAGRSASPHVFLSRVATAIAAALFLSAAIVVADNTVTWIKSGSIPFQQARLTGSKTGISYLINILLAFVAADVLMRTLKRKGILNAGNGVVAAVVATSLACAIVTGARNGFIGIVFLLFGSTLLYIALSASLSLKSKALLMTAVVMTAGALAWVSVETDSRWRVFRESAELALNSSRADILTTMKNQNASGLDLPDGRRVDDSAYIRISQLKHALLVAIETPFGVGFSRNAFGTYAKKYEGVSVGSIDTGLLDFAIGVGLPGVALWLLFIGLILKRAIAIIVKRPNAYAMITVFLVSGFVARSVIDTNMRDHMLEMFLFLAGFMATAAEIAASPRGEEPAT